jgi:hypothetical protein
MFSPFEMLLLSVTHTDRCSEDKIINSCNLQCGMSIMLYYLASKLMMKFGEPKEDDYQLVEKCLGKLHDLCFLACLDFKPKMYSLLNHGLELRWRFGGIGDSLKDDVENMHQISARIESRV